MTPTQPIRRPALIDAAELADVSSYEAARQTAIAARESVSVVEWLEHLLHPWTSFVVVPLFALANAGVALSRDAVGDALTSSVAGGIVVGLVVGKFVGIAGFTWLAARLRIARLPEDATWSGILGVSALAGIGFTVSIFITDLAFGGDPSRGPRQGRDPGRVAAGGGDRIGAHRGHVQAKEREVIGSVLGLITRGAGRECCVRDAGVVELGFFDEVAEAVRGLVASDRMDMRQQARRWGLKAWFGAERPTREHYEAQLIAPDGVDGATVSALEIGFHAEHPDAADNEAAIARLVAGQDRWRAALGDDAVVGPFLGRFPGLAPGLGGLARPRPRRPRPPGAGGVAAHRLHRRPRAVAPQ